MILERNSARLDHSLNRLVLPMGIQTFHLKATARRPFLSATLFDPDGSAVNLVGATLLFRMRNTFSRDVVINDQPAVILTNGRVRYDWQAGETDTGGEFEAWFVVDHVDGRREFFPNHDSLTVRIEP